MTTGVAEDRTLEVAEAVCNVLRESGYVQAEGANLLPKTQAIPPWRCAIRSQAKFMGGVRTRVW
ncbi:MAG: hypothetical protein ACKVPX_00535 [Myxococcaceae bacterium]